MGTCLGILCPDSTATISTVGHYNQNQAGPDDGSSQFFISRRLHCVSSPHVGIIGRNAMNDKRAFCLSKKVDLHKGGRGGRRGVRKMASHMIVLKPGASV